MTADMILRILMLLWDEFLAEALAKAVQDSDTKIDDTVFNIVNMLIGKGK